MRIRLPESERTRARRPGAALASALLHGALIALAVNATARTQHAEPAPEAPPELVYVAPTPPTPPGPSAAPARGGARSAPRAPSRAPILPSDLVAPSVALPGPIGVDVRLPGPVVGPPTFGPVAGPIGGGLPGGPASDGPLDLRQVERAAVPLAGIRPRYPAALRARGADGAVLARYVVDSAGRVRAASVEIVEATDALLADAVRAALRDARFRPAAVAGRPVAQLVEQRFLFTLRDR